MNRKFKTPFYNMPKSEQGVFHNRYQVIPRTLIFITRGEEVLLLKGAPTKRLWANRFNGIGGHIERGEDVLTAAERELAEETGLKTKNLRLCGTLMVDADDQSGIGIYIFKGEYLDGEILPSPEGTPEWVSFKNLSDLPLVEDLRTILPRVMAFGDSDSPFFGRSYYDPAEKLQVIIRD